MSKETINITIEIPADVETVYNDWLDADRHSEMTGGVAVIERREGTRFTAWDEYISGINVKLVTNAKIVQTWRTDEFEPGWEDSILEINLKASPNGGTVLHMVHSNLYPGNAEKYEEGWHEYYFRPMIMFYSK